MKGFEHMKQKKYILSLAYLALGTSIARADALTDALESAIQYAIGAGDVGVLIALTEEHPLNPKEDTILIKAIEKVLSADDKTRKSKESAIKKSVASRTKPSGKTLKEQLDELNPKLPKAFQAALETSAKNGDYTTAYQELMTGKEGAHQQALAAIGADQTAASEVTKAAGKVTKAK